MPKPYIYFTTSDGSQLTATYISRNKTEWKNFAIDLANAGKLVIFHLGSFIKTVSNTNDGNRQSIKNQGKMTR